MSHTGYSTDDELDSMLPSADVERKDLNNLDQPYDHSQEKLLLRVRRLRLIIWLEGILLLVIFAYTSLNQISVQTTIPLGVDPNGFVPPGKRKYPGKVFSTTLTPHKKSDNL